MTSGVTAISGAVPSSEPVASTSPIDSGADRGPLSVSRGGSGASADDGIPAVAGTSVFRAWCSLPPHARPCAAGTAARVRRPGAIVATVSGWVAGGNLWCYGGAQAAIRQAAAIAGPGLSGVGRRFPCAA